MNTPDQEIVTTPDQVNIADEFFTEGIINRYGSRDDVREIIHRLVKVGHISCSYGQEVVCAVAQISLITGADPTQASGELYVWVSQGQLCWHLGYKFWERRSMEQGGILFLDHPAKMTPERRDEWGVEQNAVATAYTRGIGHFQLLEKWKELKGIMQGSEIKRAYAREGIGIVHKTETVSYKNDKPISPPKGKTWQWVASKRARMDLQRQLFPLNADMRNALEMVVSRQHAESAAMPDHLPQQIGVITPQQPPQSYRPEHDKEYNTELFGFENTD